MSYQQERYEKLIKAGGKLLHNKEHGFYYIITERENMFQPAEAAYFSEEFIDSLIKEY